MKKMIATNKQRVYHYNGNKILPNEIFNVRDEHVVLLTALGWVKDMAAVKAMTAENTSALVPTPARAVSTVQSKASAISSTFFTQTDPHLTGEPTDENVAEAKAVKSDESQTNETDETLLVDSTESLTQVVKEEDNEVIQSLEYSKMLRERATALGIKVDGRWSDTRVQREIDEYNVKTYKHMDMRASE